MDPGSLAIMTMICRAVAGVVAAKTAIGGIHQYAQGSARGDYHGIWNNIIYGFVAAGAIGSAPMWVPPLLTAAYSVAASL